jgi:hypothetical protein
MHFTSRTPGAETVFREELVKELLDLAADPVLEARDFTL